MKTEGILVDELCRFAKGASLWLGMSALEAIQLAVWVQHADHYDSVAKCFCGILELYFSNLSDCVDGIFLSWR